MPSYAQEKLRTEGGVCKDLSCQKSMSGWGRGVQEGTGWHVCNLGNSTNMLRKAIWKKTLQKTLIFSDCRRSIGKKYGLPISLCASLVFWKQQNLSEFSDGVQNVWAKSCIPCRCQSYVKLKAILRNPKRPSYEFSATVSRRTCKLRFSL